MRGAGLAHVASVVVLLLFLGGAPPAAAGVHSWTPIGPDGGLINGVAADPVHPGVLYAACGFSGVFGSRDGGASWTRLSHGIGFSYVLTVAVDPTAPQRLFAGTAGYGLFRSLDAGMNWTTVDDLPLPWIPTLAVSARDGTVYAGGSGDVQNLWVSHDSGTTWVSVLATWGRVESLLLLTGVSQDVLYAATDNLGPGHPYLFRSRDAGASWTPLKGLPAVKTFSLDVQLASDASGGHLFLSAVFTDENGAILGVPTVRSTDGGDSWAPSGPGGFPLGISTDGTVVAGAWRSRDGGETWSAAATLPIREFLAADPFAGSTLFTGSNLAGLFRSTDDAASWQPRQNGLTASFVESIAAGPRSLWAAVATVGLRRAEIRPDDTAFKWLPADHGLPADAFYTAVNTIALDPRQPDVAYFAWSGPFDGTAGPGGMARTVDAGGSWQLLSQGAWDHLYPQGLWVDPILSRVLYLWGDFMAAGDSQFCRLERSTDQGAHWSCIEPANSYSYGFAAAPHSARLLYLVAADLSSAPPLRLHVWRSTDRGSTWSDVHAVGLENETLGGFLVADPTDPMHFLLSTSTPFADVGGHLFTSHDGGVHWQRVGDGLVGVPIHALTLDPVNPARVYVMDSQGLVYASTSSGLRFGPLYGGLPTILGGFGVGLVLDPANSHRVFVGLSGNGVYAYTNP